MDNVVRITVPNYKDKILHSLHKLQQNRVNCDVTLRAFNGSASIHGIILSANNSYFVGHQQTNQEIDCKKYSIHVVEAVVVFLYTGEIVIEEKYIKELMNLCEFLNSNSVCDIDQVSKNTEWNQNILTASTSDIDNSTVEYSTKNTSLHDSSIKRPGLIQSEESASKSFQKNENVVPVQLMTIHKGNDLYIKVDNFVHDTNSQPTSFNQTHIPSEKNSNIGLRSTDFLSEIRNLLNLKECSSQEKSAELDQCQKLINNVEESADFVRRQISSEVQNECGTSDEMPEKGSCGVSDNEENMKSEFSSTHLKKMKKQRENENSYEENSPKKIKIEIQTSKEMDEDEECVQQYESFSPNESVKSNSSVEESINSKNKIISRRKMSKIGSVKKRSGSGKEPRKKVVRGDNLKALKKKLGSSKEPSKKVVRGDNLNALKKKLDSSKEPSKKVVRGDNLTVLKKKLDSSKEPSKKVVRGDNLTTLKKKEVEVTNNSDIIAESDSDFTEDMSNTKNTTKQEWKCVKCNLMFSCYSERRKHMTAIHRPYPCQLCNWVGSQQRLFASHMYGQHKVVIYPKKYPLVECDVEGCSHKCLNISLYNHKRCHQFKTDKLVCDVCGMKFTSPGGLRHHASHHKEEDMKHKCRECGQVFGWIHELTKHWNAEHRNYRLCHKCPFKTKYKMTLTIHLHNNHGEPVPPNVKIYRCDTCDFYCFVPSYLRLHKEENHSDGSNYDCPICNKSFKTKKSRKNHQRTTHGTKVFRCDQCDYTTPSNKTLTIHKNSSHSDARPYACHLCEYSCKFKGNLNKHMKNIHKVEIVTSAKLKEKMLKTGKGFNEYMNARKGLMDKSQTEIQTQPVSDNNDMQMPQDGQNLLNLV